MILVFASKNVGLEVVEFLVQRGDGVDFVVAASTICDQPILDLCHQNGIPAAFYSPQTLDHLLQKNESYKWLINAWSPHILRPAILSLAERRANLHPSFVPHCRGSDSTAWCLRKNLPAGVSIIEMTEGIDEGAVYAQEQVDVPFPTKGKELHVVLQESMSVLFKRAWPEMLQGKEPIVSQDAGSYHLRKQTNEDRVRQADSAMSLEETVRWILAHDFAPGTTAEMEMDGKRYKLVLDVVPL